MATNSSQSINKRVVQSAIPMARFSIGEDDEDAPITHKRPKFSQPASQSEPHRSVQRSQSRFIVDEDEEEEEEEEEEDLIPVEDEDEEEEDEEEGDESWAVEEEEIGEDSGSEDDDEETEAVAEGQNPQQQMTVSMSASSDLGLGDVTGGRRSCGVAAPVFNNASGAIQVVLIDPDVLDCPICFDPLCSPVFQCENGHIACSLCCSKVKQKCPSCCMPIGYNRCRAIEKVIESVKTPCKNTRFGCKQTIPYNKKTQHEQTCPHAICFCPHPSCTFASSSKNLYLHFGTQHTASATRFTYNTTFTRHIQTTQKHLFLQEQHESVIFILNHEVKQNGHVFNLDCVGPSLLKTGFVYQITAKCMETCLSLQSVPETYTKWAEHGPSKNYLTIPKEFSGHNGVISLHICIKKGV